LSAPAPAGQALLYIYREGFMGKAVGWNVSLDGKALAQLRSPRFTQTTVGPGRHTLAVSLKGFAGSQNKPAETTFDAQLGEVIVFAMKSKMSALSNALCFIREPDTPTALQKLSKLPMVAAEPTVPSVAPEALQSKPPGFEPWPPATPILVATKHGNKTTTWRAKSARPVRQTETSLARPVRCPLYSWHINFRSSNQSPGF
jgi:hypothetical protein